MADQSANLSGMLSQIGQTVGSMGEAYKPVSQALSKPRGNMDDPNHLQALAQWASSNGDSAAASMYMQQARELKAEQKEAKNVAFVGRTGQVAADAQQRAQEGDVTNLDRNIEMLKERVELATESGSATQLASAQAALKGAIASRDGATQVQVQNHIKAVSAIDEALADPAKANKPVAIGNADGTTTQSTVGAELQKRRAELLKDQKVSDGIIEREVTEFQQREAEITVRGTQFLDGNAANIREAIARDDEDALQEIKDSMPAEFGTRGEAMFLDYVEDQRKIEADSRSREELASMSTPYDFESMQESVAELEEDYPELMGEINQAAAELRQLESQRSADGTVLLPKKVLAAREKLNETIKEQRSRAKGIELRVRLDAETERSGAILNLERKREAGYFEDESAIRAASNAALRYDAEYQEAAASEDFEEAGKRAEEVTAQIRKEQEQEFYNRIDSELRALGVEVEEPEAPKDAYISDSGQSLMPSEVSEFVADRGEEKFRSAARAMGFSPEAINEMLGTDAPKADPKEPTVYRREPGLPRDIFGLESKYDQNIAGLAARRSAQ